MQSGSSISNGETQAKPSRNRVGFHRGGNRRSFPPITETSSIRAVIPALLSRLTPFVNGEIFSAWDRARFTFRSLPNFNSPPSHQHQARTGSGRAIGYPDHWRVLFRDFPGFTRGCLWVWSSWSPLRPYRVLTVRHHPNLTLRPCGDLGVPVPACCQALASPPGLVAILLRPGLDGGHSWGCFRKSRNAGLLGSQETPALP